MSYLLQLDSSADVRHGTSRELVSEFSSAWVAAGPDREIRRRDLHTQPLPHLPTKALHFDESIRPDDVVAPEPEAVALQDELLAELTDAEAVVIAAPMYNYAMPSTVKAWLDYVHVLGRTSPFENDAAPLRGKPVVVLSTRVLPTGSDPITDFVVGPFHAVLGGFMGMAVTSFVAHVGEPASPDDFHRPFDAVRSEVREFAATVGS